MRAPCAVTSIGRPGKPLGIMMKKFGIFGVVALIATLLFLVTRMTGVEHMQQEQGDTAQEKIPASYVVSADRRIYKIDLESSQIIATSEPIEGIGRPTSIDIDRQNGRLYIGSDRGRGQREFTPLLVVDVNEDRFSVLERFTIDPLTDSADDSTVSTPQVHAVYGLMLSPDGKELYLGYGGPGHKLTVVLDSFTGAIIREIDLPMFGASVYTFSPDGRKIAEMWPAGSAVIEQDGTEARREWGAGVAVGDLLTGKWISKTALEDGRGLRAPWESTSEPFVYFRDSNRVMEVFDRDTGTVLSRVDLSKLTGLQLEHKATTIGDTGLVALPMTGSAQKGYIVIFDIDSQEIASKIEVGQRPSNIALADS